MPDPTVTTPPGPAFTLNRRAVEFYRALATRRKVRTSPESRYVFMEISRGREVVPRRRCDALAREARDRGHAVEGADGIWSLTPAGEAALAAAVGG